MDPHKNNVLPTYGMCHKCGMNINLCICRGAVIPPNGTISPNPPLAPFAPIEVNEKGGKQSSLPGLYTELPKALRRVAEIQKKGHIKYGPENWKKIEAKSHLDHALYHIYQYLGGDTSEPHLAHAACRLLMALEKDIG